MTTQKPTWIPLLVLLAIAVAALFLTSVPGVMPTEGLDTGDTAWMIVASGLVLLMTPGLAYFYGGMVNHKNVISTMLQSFIAMGVISVIWIVFGFSLYTQTTPFNFEIFAKWGIVLALFGTIIPPMLLNAGFPHTGIGLGSIVSSLELPVSVMMAYFLLNEQVLLIQWIGILLIITAIVIMNIQFKKKK